MALQVELFGSNATGLSLCSSDFDLVLRQRGLVPRAALQRLSRRGRSTGVAQAHKAEVIRSAKVPIFKFIEARSGLPFDVCVNSEGGLRNSAAVRRVLQEHPELRPLLLVLKAMLQQANLHQTYSGGVGSYLLFSMALPLVGVEGPLTGDDDGGEGEHACEYVAEEEEEEE